MPWRDVVRSSGYLRAVVFIGLALFGALSQAPAAAAVSADTQIGAKVCGSNPSGALLDITQPNDDSVVNQTVVTVRGTVASASQIVVELDGSYNSTVAMEANQVAFAIDLALPEGTHTITLRANEVCGGADGVDTVVVTYTPEIDEPSNGETTPTEIEGGGVIINPEITDVETEAIAENDIMRRIEQLPLIGAAVSVVSDFATAIGLENTIVGNNTPAIAGVARVGITVAALTSVVMASTLAPLAVQAVPGVSEVFNVSSHRSMMYLGWIIRGAGVLAMAIVYFL